MKKSAMSKTNETYSKTKAFLPLCLALALSKFWQETVYMMSYFLESDLGISAQEIILTSKYQPLGVAIGYVLTAIFVDRIGIKKMLAGCMFVMSIIIFLFTQVSSLSMLYVYRIALGFCIGLIYNAAFGGLSVIFSKEELPKSTSRLYMCGFGATLISPRLLTDISNFYDWKIVLYCVMVLTFLGCLAAFRWFPQKVNAMDITKYLQRVKSLLTHKMFMMMAIVSTLCMGGFYGFVAIFAKNLAVAGASTTVSKFIITDVQFISRLIIFVLTTWAGYRLTRDNLLKYLKVCLVGMCAVGLALFAWLLTQHTLLPDSNTMDGIIALAGESKHVFSYLITNNSGFILFFIYAAFMAIAQPANKSKALTIAGKDAGGIAQAIIGFCLSMGEVIFVMAAQASWPTGSAAFFAFVALAAVLVLMGLRYVSRQSYVEHE